MFNRSVTSYIRKTTKAFLTTPCTIEAEETSQDTSPEGYGQNITAWNAVYVGKCRLLPAGVGDSEKATEFAGQEGIDEMKRLILPFNTALDVGQRVVIGSKIFYVASLDVANTDEVFRAAIIVRKAGSDG